jgi:hypothetical protein
MSWYIFLLGFIGIVAMGDTVLGLFGVLYSVIKDEKKLEFFSKVTVYSFLICIVSFSLILYFEAR